MSKVVRLMGIGDTSFKFDWIGGTDLTNTNNVYGVHSEKTWQELGIPKPKHGDKVSLNVTDGDKSISGEYLVVEPTSGGVKIINHGHYENSIFNIVIPGKIDRITASGTFTVIPVQSFIQKNKFALILAGLGLGTYLLRNKIKKALKK